MPNYLKSSMHDATLVICLLMFVIALQTFLSRTSLVEVEDVEVVIKLVRCVEYFFSYALHSDIKATLTSLPVINRSAFKLSLILLIKKSTPDN